MIVTTKKDLKSLSESVDCILISVNYAIQMPRLNWKLNSIYETNNNYISYTSLQHRHLAPKISEKKYLFGCLFELWLQTLNL